MGAPAAPTSPRETGPARTGAPDAVGGPRSPRRGGVYAVVAVLVAVVVVLAALLGLGIVRFPTAPSPNATSSFAMAETAAKQAANNYSGQSWTPWLAVGFVPSTATSLPINYTYYAFVRAGCTFSPVNSGVRQLLGSSNVSRGQTSAWLFEFADPSSEFLLVSSVEGAATVVGTLLGPSCPDQFPSAAALPASTIDPEQAAATAAEAGGYRFLSQHPQANVTLSVVNHQVGWSSMGPQWTVIYSDCPTVTSLNFTGDYYVGIVNGTTGAFESAQNLTGSCPRLGQVATIPLANSLAVTNAFTAFAGGTYWYNFTVRTISDPMTLDDLGFQLENSSGVPLGVPAARLSVVGLSGVTLGEFNLTTGVWTLGAGVTLTAGDRFVLESPVNLGGQGDWLNVSGRVLFSGSIGLSIP